MWFQGLRAQVVKATPAATILLRSWGTSIELAQLAVDHPIKEEGMELRKPMMLGVPPTFDNDQLPFVPTEMHGDEIVRTCVLGQQTVLPYPALPLVDRRDETGQATLCDQTAERPGYRAFHIAVQPRDDAQPPIGLDHGFDLGNPIEQVCATVFLHPCIVFDIHPLLGMTSLVVGSRYLDAQVGIVGVDVAMPRLSPSEWVKLRQGEHALLHLVARRPVHKQSPAVVDAVLESEAGVV